MLGINLFKQKLKNACALLQQRKLSPFEAKAAFNPQSPGFKILAIGIITPGKKNDE